MDPKAARPRGQPRTLRNTFRADCGRSDQDDGLFESSSELGRADAPWRGRPTGRKGKSSGGRQEVIWPLFTPRLTTSPIALEARDHGNQLLCLALCRLRVQGIPCPRRNGRFLHKFCRESTQAAQPDTMELTVGVPRRPGLSGGQTCRSRWKA